MSYGKSKEKNCEKCGIKYQTTGRFQRYCGSRLEKTGCSFLVAQYRKTHTKDGHRRATKENPYYIHSALLDVARCDFCGTTKKLSLDHIIPRIIGGGHEKENLRVLCRSCNSKRHHNLVRNAMRFYFENGRTE